MRPTYGLRTYFFSNIMNLSYKTLIYPGNSKEKIDFRQHTTKLQKRIPFLIL